MDFIFNIQYRQDLRDYLEILNSRFPDETVKKIQFILLILSDNNI